MFKRQIHCLQLGSNITFGLIIKVKPNANVERKISDVCCERLYLNNAYPLDWQNNWLVSMRAKHWHFLRLMLLSFR